MLLESHIIDVGGMSHEKLGQGYIHKNGITNDGVKFCLDLILTRVILITIRNLSLQRLYVPLYYRSCCITKNTAAYGISVEYEWPKQGYQLTWFVFQTLCKLSRQVLHRVEVLLLRFFEKELFSFQMYSIVALDECLWRFLHFLSFEWKTLFLGNVSNVTVVLKLFCESTLFGRIFQNQMQISNSGIFKNQIKLNRMNRNWTKNDRIEIFGFCRNVWF